MDILSSDESGDEKGLRINKKFASKYEATARFKDLQRGKEFLEDNEDDSDASSEDEDGEALSAGVDVQIMKTINSIRKKDPSIYDANAKWFQPEDSDGSDSEDGGASKKKQTYKDVLREQLLRDGADVDADGAEPQLKGFAKKNANMSYDPEQEKLRQAFLASVGDDGSDSGSGSEGTAKGGLLVAKRRAEADLKEAQARRALETEMETLVELGKSRGAPEAAKDAFLVDYFKQQKWKGHEFKDAEARSDPASDSDAHADDDDEEVDRADNFESKYNFRFQELLGAEAGPGLQGLQVTGHARNVEGSLRRSDDKRKLQREALRERKERERRQKEEELKRLKNLKRRELRARLEKIAAVGGVGLDDEEEGADEEAPRKKEKKSKRGKKAGKARLVVNAAQLDDDWDPEAHEALMAAQFGDDYYGDEDAGDDFGDDAEAHRFALEAAAEDAGLGWEGEDEEGAGGLQALAGEDEDVAVDAALPALSKSKRQRNRDKKAAKAREGALGAADEDAGLDAAALEELYALDYEDVIGGDTLCRFRYRQVETQDYGLTVDDILAADDKELNQFRSIKKYSAYRHGDAPAGPDGGARHAYGRDDDEEEASKLSKKRKRLRAAIRERAAEEAARLAAVEAAAPTAAVASLLAPKKAASVPAAETADSDGDSDDGARKPGEKRKRKRKHKKSGAADDGEKEKEKEQEQEKETSSVKVAKKAEKAPAHVAATAAAAPDAAAAKKKKKHSGAKPKARDPQEVRMSLYR